MLAGDEQADIAGDLLTIDPARELVLDETANDASRLAPGQRFGRYESSVCWDRAAWAKCMRPSTLEHGRRIALKVLSPGLSDAIDRARFLREGQLAAAVNHPHLVYVYGSEDISGMPAIAMELLPGGTLKERVENEGPLAPVEAIDVILQVVSGLEAAHDAGVLHRDIKPSNCFVDVDGTVKVGDFGLAIPALEHISLTAIGTVQGTPQFASPEQLRGKPLDVRSDIYAVGATLYYLLTGRPPFDDRELIALVSRIATELPTSPHEVRPAVPKAVAAVVLLCLAKDPSHRPASYRALVNMLEPLGSIARTPAPLGIRTAAYFFDTFFSIVLPVNILLGTFVHLARPSSVFGAKPVLVTFCAMSYFAIAEGVWGASLGKALCGLRVVTESGAPPRFARAFVRALIFFLPAWLASGLVVSLTGLAYSMQGRSAIMATAAQIGVQVLLIGNGTPCEWICGHSRMGDPDADGVEVSCRRARDRPVSAQPDRYARWPAAGWTVPDRGDAELAARCRPGIRRSASTRDLAAVSRSGSRRGSACETQCAQTRTATLVSRTACARAGVGRVRTRTRSTIRDVGGTGAVVGDGPRMAL